MTHTEFRDKKNKNNIDMVTQIETLFIFMFDEEFFYMQLFFIRISFLHILKDCLSNVNIFIIFLGRKW